MKTSTSPAKFEPNGYYEKLLKMRASGKLDITLLSIPTRTVLAQYEALKREHELLNEKGAI